jgi:hypothetical protein
MAKARYEYCPIADLRLEVDRRLALYAPSGPEGPAAFWSRVEQAGKLAQALELYDRLTAERAEQAEAQCETKHEFTERVKREGREAEVERLREELLGAGLSQREVQAQLVERFQPLDGSRTRAWETPDPWQQGRLFRRKEDERRLVAWARGGETSSRNEAIADAKARVSWANRRADERQALAAARRRAQVLKVAAQEEARRQAEAAKQKPAPQAVEGEAKPSANGQPQRPTTLTRDGRSWEVI